MEAEGQQMGAEGQQRFEQKMSVVISIYLQGMQSNVPARHGNVMKRLGCMDVSECTYHRRILARLRMRPYAHLFKCMFQRMERFDRRPSK